MSAKPKPLPEPDPETPLKDYREIPALKGTPITKLFTKKLLLDADRKSKEKAVAVAKAAADAVGEQIKGILTPLGLLGTIINGQSMRVQGAGGQKTINPDKMFDALLEEGVEAARARAIIDGATDTAKSSTYVRIYPAKE